ncbi:hypothetical protein HKL94_00235 [Candidatus Parcubacteria bacterium]|nr:hypothetical protein [Candidatus Parcubacteria bacterium]
MRVLFLSFVAALLILLHGVGVNAQTMASNTFTTNLSLGSSGAQVVALQKILNQDPDTRIASTGPGSPGNETSYFGILTNAAVIRFQEKYANAILVPAGLMQGNGYVGLYTREKLNALSAVAVNTNSSATSSASGTSTPLTTASSIVPQNPNLKNIGIFMTDLDALAAKQGLSSSTLATIKQAVMKEVATTTDLRAAFLNMVQNESPKAVRENSLLGTALATLGKAFDAIFTPEPVFAASDVPFGGALVYPLYCTQSETWLLAIEPLPPSYATLLSYVPYSQAFSSYNIPATNWLLGFYTPGAGVCVEGVCPYCVTIPNEGMITPEVGSSPS